MCGRCQEWCRASLLLGLLLPGSHSELLLQEWHHRGSHWGLNRRVSRPIWNDVYHRVVSGSNRVFRHRYDLYVAFQPTRACVRVFELHQPAESRPNVCDGSLHPPALLHPVLLHRVLELHHRCEVVWLPTRVCWHSELPPGCVPVSRHRALYLE